MTNWVSGVDPANKPDDFLLRPPSASHGSLRPRSAASARGGVGSRRPDSRGGKGPSASMGTAVPAAPTEAWVHGEPSSAANGPPGSEAPAAAEGAKPAGHKPGYRGFQAFVRESIQDRSRIDHMRAVADCAVSLPFLMSIAQKLDASCSTAEVRWTACPTHLPTLLPASSARLPHPPAPSVCPSLPPAPLAYTLPLPAPSPNVDVQPRTGPHLTSSRPCVAPPACPHASRSCVRSSCPSHSSTSAGWWTCSSHPMSALPHTSSATGGSRSSCVHPSHRWG